jgi:adenylate cyclase class 2
MGYEVEVKYRHVDHDQVTRWLNDRGATCAPAIEQVDIYLSHPSRDFVATNEALRIRRIGGENRITYKGPRLTGPTKTREEIEISFREGDDAFHQLLRLFENLGFRQVATVRKRRQSFHLNLRGRDLEVALDKVDGLGDFAEVEALVDADSGLAAAQAAVLALADELRLTHVEARSYLRMSIESRGQATGSTPSGPRDTAAGHGGPAPAGPSEPG